MAVNEDGGEGGGGAAAALLEGESGYGESGYGVYECGGGLEVHVYVLLSVVL